MALRDQLGDGASAEEGDVVRVCLNRGQHLAATWRVGSWSSMVTERGLDGSRRRPSWGWHSL